jgi:hypothetical protein
MYAKKDAGPSHHGKPGRVSKQRPTDYSHGEERMSQNAAVEVPEEVAGEYSLKERSPFPPVESNYKLDSLVVKKSRSLQELILTCDFTVINLCAKRVGEKSPSNTSTVDSAALPLPMLQFGDADGRSSRN